MNSLEALSMMAMCKFRSYLIKPAPSAASKRGKYKDLLWNYDLVCVKYYRKQKPTAENGVFETVIL
jgi:hypothetical protein